MRLLLLSCLMWIFIVVYFKSTYSSKLLQALFTIPAFIYFKLLSTFNTSVALSLLERTLSFREQSFYFGVSS